MSQLIKPYGSNQLSSVYESDQNQRVALSKLALELPNIVISSQAAANIVMLASGYFNPLRGFMNLADAKSVAEHMTTKNGLFWPIPIVNITATKPQPDRQGRLALIDPNVGGDSIIAIQNVDNIELVSSDDLLRMASQIFGTTDLDHPGVSNFVNQGTYLISGSITALNYSYFRSDFSNIFATATEIRDQLTQQNWSKVVAFQTRNPMHRAHEELCQMALQDLNADGVLIHMLLGKLKQGDIPANVRIDAIQTMVDHYFKPNTAMVKGYGFDMLYAGPKEAILHAIFRQNCGCSHLIVGRDHAGVGSYYGAFDAQTIFDTIAKDALQIQIYRADHTAYSKKLNRVVMMKDAIDHSKEDFILLSGTKVREMLGSGIKPPPEFSRPEVAQILIDYYQTID